MSAAVDIERYHERLSYHSNKALAFDASYPWRAQAIRRIVEEVVEMDIDFRENDRDRGIGWQGISPTATLGEVGGGSSRGGVMEKKYDRGIWNNEEQTWAHQEMMKLPVRQRLALLISRRKRKARAGEEHDMWCQDNATIIKHIRRYGLALKFSAEEISKCKFETSTVMSNCAKKGRISLILSFSG